MKQQPKIPRDNKILVCQIAKMKKFIESLLVRTLMFFKSYKRSFVLSRNFKWLSLNLKSQNSCQEFESRDSNFFAKAQT